ncbi:MAG: hypothetical protein PWQ89_1426 [Verrucomicrobiota bacterium]|nr:hypothetical protein [Verrucomicrobiota bacterium]
MKKILTVLIVLTVSIYAQEAGLVKVTGDRVSLRAAPEVTAVLLDRAMSGDELVLKDNSNSEWVGVEPPETVDLWVSRDFIRDGIVLPAKLNVRSGPSLSHHVVGVLKKGEPVTVRSEVDGWLRISPTPETTVWISRKYTEVTVPEPAIPEESVAAFSPAEKPVIETPVIPAEPGEADVEIEIPQEEVLQMTAVPPEQKMTTAAVTAEVSGSGTLRVDPNKEQGVEESFSGVLQPADSILYKLVDPGFEEITVCYVLGNQDQMNAYAQLPLKLTGKVYWAEGMDMPVIRPDKIQVLDSVPNG